MKVAKEIKEEKRPHLKSTSRVSRVVRVRRVCVMLRREPPRVGAVAKW